MTVTPHRQTHPVQTWPSRQPTLTPPGAEHTYPPGVKKHTFATVRPLQPTLEWSKPHQHGYASRATMPPIPSAATDGTDCSHATDVQAMPSAVTSATRSSQRCQLCAARRECLIGQLPRPHLERLLPLVHERAFRKGESLQSEGQAPNTLSSIKLGSVMLTRAGPDGVPRPVALVGRGHLLGLAALLGEQTQVGAQAVSAGRCCELAPKPLRQLLASDPALMADLHRHLLHVVARLADWGQVLRLRGLPRQLMGALMLMADEQGSRTVHLPSQVTLAALLATTRESVARALRQLDDSGQLRRIDRWHGELTGTHQHIFHDAAAH